MIDYVKKFEGNTASKISDGKKMPKEKAPYKSLSIIMIDSVVKAKKKYYPQTLLEEGKYESKKIKMEKSSSDDSDSKSDNDSNDDLKSDDEKDNDESNE